MITDGQVHDIPANKNALGFDAPLHSLVTGKPDEFDRRIRFNKAPRYGISGKPLEMSFTVIDEGKNPAALRRSKSASMAKPSARKKRGSGRKRPSPSPCRAPV